VDDGLARLPLAQGLQQSVDYRARSDQQRLLNGKSVAAAASGRRRATASRRGSAPRDRARG
jgi:hypothetical protein